MEDNCGLCKGIYETGRVVHVTNTTYSMIPLHPLREGHILVLPKRHVVQASLTPEESHELNIHLAQLVDKIALMYPDTPPFFTSMGNTKHASIPNHFHYHVLANKVNLRELLARYHPELPEVIPTKKEAEVQELERMAQLFRY